MAAIWDPDALMVGITGFQRVVAPVGRKSVTRVIRQADLLLPRFCFATQETKRRSSQIRETPPTVFSSITQAQENLTRVTNTVATAERWRAAHRVHSVALPINGPIRTAT